MNRQQLEHVIRAAAHIADDEELIIIGSQSILGQFPAAPDALLVSNEADLFPKNKPELADLIDGTIGELSPFHETFGYYAHGVEEAVAVLPQGWKSRLVAIRNPSTRGATGWCLEIHDLLVSKLVAGREKDLDYASVAVQHGLAQVQRLSERVEITAVTPETRQLLQGRLQRISQSSIGSKD